MRFYIHIFVSRYELAYPTATACLHVYTYKRVTSSAVGSHGAHASCYTYNESCHMYEFVTSRPLDTVVDENDTASETHAR